MNNPKRYEGIFQIFNFEGKMVKPFIKTYNFFIYKDLDWNRNTLRGEGHNLEESQINFMFTLQWLKIRKSEKSREYGTPAFW